MGRIDNAFEYPEIRSYAEFLILKRMRPNTQKGHILRLFKIRQVLDKSLLDANRDDLRRVLGWINNHKQTNASYTAYVGTIKSFYFDFWIEHFQGKKPPMLSAKKDPLFQYASLKPRVVVMSKEQINAFLKVCMQDPNPIWYPFFLFIYDCGLRLGEAIYSSDKLINRKKLFYSVENLTYRGKLLDGYAIKYSLRRVDMGRKPPISQMTITAIDNWLKIRPPPSHEMYKDLLFLDNREVSIFGRKKLTDRYGLPLYSSLVERKFKKLIETCIAKCPYLKWSNFVVHDLRATFITHQLLSGVPGEVIAKWVGHSSTRSLLQYIRLIEEQLLRKDWRGAAEVSL